MANLNINGHIRDIFWGHISNYFFFLDFLLLIFNIDISFEVINIDIYNVNIWSVVTNDSTNNYNFQHAVIK
jgi:hypothetical protein